MKKWSIVLMVSFLAGCGSAKVDLPPNFGKLSGQTSFNVRGVSASGVVVAVRTEKNELRADSGFWAELLDRRLTEGGYTRETLDPVKLGGLEGKSLRYSRKFDGRQHRYWLAVVTTPNHVYLIEAGGDAEVFDPQKGEIEKVMTSFRP